MIGRGREDLAGVIAEPFEQGHRRTLMNGSQGDLTLKMSSGGPARYLFCKCERQVQNTGIDIRQEHSERIKAWL